MACVAPAVIKSLAPCLCIIMGTLMFNAACCLRWGKDISWCISIIQVRQWNLFFFFISLKGRAAGWASVQCEVERPPWRSLCPRPWIDAGEEIARCKAGRSGSVYLLFLPTVAAHDRQVLLNWALNAHTAALKLPDGWEGINSSCCRQKLQHSNSTITQVGLACARG